ncbi:MAG TPA: NAD(P)H-dependent oxidoreductase [Thermomicrobiales bacterium]|nr:NAD(P)H-dependent oxidoreductase [Thermomicrobiales bacterium]
MEEPEEIVRIMVVYYSRFGAIAALAGEIAAGARAVAAVEVQLLPVDERPLDEPRPGESADDALRRRAALLNDLTAAHALVVGAPAYFGSMASPLKRFFEDCATASTARLDRSRPWHHYLFLNKVGAAFTSSGTPHGGNEQTLHSILTLLMHLGLIIVTPGQRGPILEHPAAPYGATAITGPEGNRGLSAEEVEEARHLGQRVAEVTTWLRRGWREGAGRPRTPEQEADRPFDPSA